jgi:iron complex transport system substrate-binding protein
MRALLLVLLFLAGALPAAAATYPLKVRDALGREVVIPSEPKAVLLGSGFNLVALSLIHPDPVSVLAGWASDLKTDNPAIYAGFRDRFPDIEKVPVVSDGVTVSAEAALSLKTDLAILANWQVASEPGRQAVDFLEKTGVPVIVVDFNSDALKNTAPMMRLLGRVLNREEQANAFADFYEQRLHEIRARVAGAAKPGPTVLMDAFPNPDKCCYAYGTGGLGEFIALTGSRNLAEDLPKQGSLVSPEFMLSANPDVYIATASPGGTYSPFSVGPGVDDAEARRTLADAVKSPYLSHMSAVRDGRVHGLWNFFNAVPLNILAAEAFAHWLRPDLFADTDPRRTLDEINRRFAAAPFEGAYWTSLTGQP